MGEYNPITKYKNLIIDNEEYIIELLLKNGKPVILKNILTEKDDEIKLLKNEIADIKQENKNLKKNITEMKQVINLNEKMVGDHSMYKGEYQEKKMELILTEYFSTHFEIIGDKHMKCMDIRVKNKEKGYIIGIECKYKKSITKRDIDKFKSDKITNEFKGSIFLSTSAPIKEYVDIKNSYSIKNDELYIYSDDDIYIIMVIQQYINYIECNLEETNITIDRCIDHLSNLYNNWNNIKKCCVKMDIDLINYLNDIGLSIENGHLYITSKNKCKNNKNPYTIDENKKEITNEEKKGVTVPEIIIETEYLN